MTDGTVVAVEMGLRLVVAGHDEVPLTALVRYQASDPYAIEMALDTGQAEPVRWMFARDLLVDGLHNHAGDGDVRFWPTDRDPDLLNISLSSPDGQAHLQAPLTAIVSFLDRTFDAVPSGHESGYIDIQNELNTLLHSP
jgi:Streptomyces sporulation and cell division protein, SsgA